MSCGNVKLIDSNASFVYTSTPCQNVYFFRIIFIIFFILKSWQEEREGMGLERSTSQDSNLGHPKRNQAVRRSTAGYWHEYNYH